MKRTDTLEYKTIEWLRFALAVVVVLLHSYYLEVLAPGTDRFIPILLSAGICRVAVPTFFLISGYLFFKGLENWDSAKWGRKLLRRVKTLLIPYLLWNIITLLAQFARMTIKGIPFTVTEYLSERGWVRIFWDCNRLGGGSSTNILGYEMHYGGMPMDNSLWFIRDLMVVCILAPVIYLFVKKTGKAGLAAVLILLMLSVWIPLEGFSAVAFLFFSAGAYLSINGKGLVDTAIRYGKASVIVSMVLLGCMMASYYCFKTAYEYLCNLFIVAGSFATIYTASSLIRTGHAIVHQSLSASSFFIYALHMATLMTFVGMVTCKLIAPVGTVSYLFDYFFIPSATIGICLVLFFAMKKICPRLLSLLIGGRID